MASPSISPSPSTGRVSFRWILDKKNDLVWYIGSALVGWLYVALILLAVRSLANPMQDSFGVIRLGGLEIPLTLQLLVYASWAFLIDAPHVFSTLARTFLDPEERATRRKELWFSWVWFLVGPAVMLAPYGLDLLARPFGMSLPTGALQIGAILFTVFFRLWAYYHVVRQHWGFYMLYKRKNNDMDPAAAKADYWFFHIAFYAPLVMFITGAIYGKTPGMPPLGLDRIPFMYLVHYAAWAAFLGIIAYYFAFQVHLWRSGKPLNGPKLIMMALLVPLHLLAFNNPWLAAMLVPIVTVGHNLQYHRIVWQFGQNKYQQGGQRPGFVLARTIFSRAWIYMGTGLLFTFAFYRGPWIDWLQNLTGVQLNQTIFAGVGMMAGLADPTTLTLGQQLFGAFIIGWAMQHYYLDAKIWRVSKDKTVAKQLGVSETQS